MFSRILVPTDFSPPSQMALEQARLLAEHFHASLQLLHVVEEPESASGFVADGFAPATVGMRAAQFAQARDALTRIVSATDRTRLHLKTEVVAGVPAAAIVDYANSTATTLIVMGTHGRTGLAHLLMGSVAEQVVRTASCAVLTVRHVPAAQEVTMALAACRAPLSA